MTLDSFIPKFLKKLDAYLLRKHPNLWVTNIHYVVFYTLIFDSILYGLTRLKGFDITGPLSDPDTPISLMIVPAVLIFLFWFIKQARYNVDKNYGRSNIGHDYQNFFVYVVSIFLITSTIFVIPQGLSDNMKSAIPLEQLDSDTEKLNNGYAYFTKSVSFVNDEIVSRRSPIYIYKRDYYADRGMNKTVPVNREMALKEIKMFISTYNKYSDDKLAITPLQVFKTAQSHQAVNLNNYGRYDARVNYKLERMYSIYRNRNAALLSNSDFLKFIFGIVGFLALATWIFKNVHWKNFLAAGITILLSPLAAGVIAVILYSLLQLNDTGPNAAFAVIILVNFFSFLWFIIPVLNKKYSSMSVINGILLQLWLPFSVFFYSLMVYDTSRRGYDYYSDNYEEFHNWWESYLMSTYWIGWALLLISIPVMKRFYKYMWALPKSK
ncbi:MAG: hypothetical protein ACJASQ_000067 [Crocinitomicaceae bacterium]|jgi:hypothetical protein